MTIRADLSTLPKAESSIDGEPPDATPRFVHLLVEKMARKNAADGDKPTAYGTRIRHSDAGQCARRVAYAAAGIPKSDPMDLAGTWVTSLGTMIHEGWQEALVARFPDAQVEPKLRIEGLDASGHADAVIDIEEDPSDTQTTPSATEVQRSQHDAPKEPKHPGMPNLQERRPGYRRVLYELKTCGGYSYKLRVGERGQAEGPSHEHKAQAALNAVAVDADEMVIGYMATEAISKAAAARKQFPELLRFAAEWTIPREVFEPIAFKEQERLQGILDLLDRGLLAARKVPDPDLPVRAEIVDPTISRWEVTDADGRITDTGSLWGGQYCSYCPYQTLCITTEPGRIPVSSVKEQAA